jgi:hypothetical protein
VVFALCSVGVHLLFAKKDDFDFATNPAAMIILGSYLGAYSFRIYIMNYYKNTRPKDKPHDNKGFYAIEQMSAVFALALIAVVLLALPSGDGDSSQPSRLTLFQGAVLDPRPMWQWAILAGMAFGVVSFFSVFIFMFKGRTATFAGLVNRLTSLAAGAAATLAVALAFDMRMPSSKDWWSLGFIVVAVTFLARAERRRRAELSRG